MSQEAVNSSAQNAASLQKKRSRQRAAAAAGRPLTAEQRKRRARHIIWDMEDAIEQQLARIAELEQANGALKRKQEVLAKTVAVRDRQVQMLKRFGVADADITSELLELTSSSISSATTSAPSASSAPLPLFSSASYSTYTNAPPPAASAVPLDADSGAAGCELARMGAAAGGPSAASPFAARSTIAAPYTSMQQQQQPVEYVSSGSAAYQIALFLSKIFGGVFTTQQNIIAPPNAVQQQQQQQDTSIYCKPALLSPFAPGSNDALTSANSLLLLHSSLTTLTSVPSLPCDEDLLRVLLQDEQEQHTCEEQGTWVEPARTLSTLMTRVPSLAAPRRLLPPSSSPHGPAPSSVQWQVFAALGALVARIQPPGSSASAEGDVQPLIDVGAGVRLQGGQAEQELLWLLRLTEVQVMDVYRRSSQELSQLLFAAEDASSPGYQAAMQQVVAAVHTIRTLGSFMRVCNPSFARVASRGVTARMERASESHWDSVARSLRLSPQQVQDVWALNDMRGQWEARIQHEHQAVGSMLSDVVWSLQAYTWQVAHGPVEVLQAQMADKVHRAVEAGRWVHVLVDDVMMSHLLTEIQVARYRVHAYPYCPDALALVQAICRVHPQPNPVPAPAPAALLPAPACADHTVTTGLGAAQRNTLGAASAGRAEITGAAVQCSTPGPMLYAPGKPQQAQVQGSKGQAAAQRAAPRLRSQGKRTRGGA